jgi:hypothetical protein
MPKLLNPMILSNKDMKSWFRTNAALRICLKGASKNASQSKSHENQAEDPQGDIQALSPDRLR